MAITSKELFTWISTLGVLEKIEFAQLFLADMTVMNRAILDNPQARDVEIINCLKWSNELAHRIHNIVFELKRSQNGQNDIADNIIFYANQSKELAGHLAATLQSTHSRYLHLKETE